MTEQDEQRISKIVSDAIYSEIDKLRVNPIIREVHLHVHIDSKDDPFRFIKGIEGMQSAIMQARIMEAIKDKLS